MGIFGKSKQEKKQEQMGHRLDAFHLIVANQRMIDVVAEMQAGESKNEQKKLGMIWSIFLDYSLFTLLQDFDLSDGFQHGVIEAMINDGNETFDSMFVTIENYNAAKLAVANKSEFAFEVLDKARDALKSAVDGETKPFAYELLNSKAEF